MAVNRGKDFENQIKEAFERVPQTAIIRLIDPQNGYAGVRNICDFIAYRSPHMYCIECKSHYGNTLPFTCITDNQWSGLLKMSKIHGVVAGVIVWFMDWDKTYFVPIQELQRLKDQGSKSLNIKMLLNSPTIDCTELLGKKKRVLFDYDLKEFLHV